MSPKLRTALGLGLAGLLTLLALALVLDQIAMFSVGPDKGAFVARILAPVLGLFLLTLVHYALALAVPHTRLALWQGIATGVYGLVMLVGGGLAIFAGIAAFGGLVALLLAFPFGTIAYFVRYTCPSEGDAISTALGDNAAGCFAGAQVIVVAAVLLKVLAYAVLLVASVKFVKVKGLIWAVATTAAFGAVLFAVYIVLKGMTFLLYPADAVLTALLGVAVAIYGIVTAIKALFAIALAVAAQAG